MKQPSQSERARALYELYSRDISAEDLQDALDAFEKVGRELGLI